MSYGDQFNIYRSMVLELNYIGPKSLMELKTILEGIIAILELATIKDEQFEKSRDFRKRQFEIDLKIINNLKSGSKHEVIEDVFYECKKQTLIDLSGAATSFKNW